MHNQSLAQKRASVVEIRTLEVPDQQTDHDETCYEDGPITGIKAK